VLSLPEENFTFLPLQKKSVGSLVKGRFGCEGSGKTLAYVTSTPLVFEFVYTGVFCAVK
jgi:hypothetical protein